MLMGNLTRDPEMRYTSSNQPVANFGIAVNRRFTTSNGEKREEATFIDCEAWGRTAEVICQYLSKGRPLFIEGRLRLDQWTDQQDQKRSRIRVVVESFQFIDSRGESGSHQQSGSSNYNDNADSNQSHNHGGNGGSSSDGGNAGGGGHQPIEEDDIPF